MGLLIVVAVSCSLMQYFLAIDNFEWMVFVLILSTGFVFASLFALLQVKAFCFSYRSLWRHFRFIPYLTFLC